MKVPSRKESKTYPLSQPIISNGKFNEPRLITIHYAVQWFIEDGLTLVMYGCEDRLALVARRKTSLCNCAVRLIVFLCACL